MSFWQLPQAAPSSNLSNSDESNLVDLHNAFRRKNGISTTLRYNESLSQQATIRASKLAANKCALEHGDNEGVGQNLAMIAYALALSDTIQMMVGSWESESLNDRFALNHASQMVWSNSSGIGCAKGFGQVGNQYPFCQVLVCNYWPQGNFVGESWKTGV
ncbi:Cysteine-rich secretory protein 2 [Podochytrium sp. JEL0797]|nr:Cysteine-rich secretory protein 2 [Podochytrium sp. JEL0797]